MEIKMLKITALNESEDEDSGEDVSLTKEAQEAIAEFEYMRAIRLKCDGKVEHALLLLQDLLETKVLNEISIDKKNDKLLAIRYNCYKNIAFIFEERKEVHKALQNYVLATKLDENDVYTMSRLGHLALKTKQLDMADYAFENCLYRNPFHWAAADGMLRLLCQNNNIIGAYSWAIKILLKDPNYNRALDVVSEINNMFPDILSFYETVCLTPKVKFSVHKKIASLLTNYESAQETAYHTFEPIILNKLQIEEINWLTVGKHITCKYKSFKASNTEIMFVLDINCLHKTVEVTEQNTQNLESYKTETLDKEKFQETVINISKESGMEAEADTSEQEINEAHNLPSVVGSENISHPIHQAESTNEDLDSNIKNDNIDNYKPKSRRRCSDLHFLEQWGWHKNRRYSSRKKNQPDIEIDASFKGYLERIFSKHMKRNFETAWPFGGNSGCSKIDTSFEKCYNIHSIQKFQKETQIGFDNFLTELQKSHFDLLSLIYKWLKFVSEYWTLSFPEDLKTVYVSVFALYKDHFDISSWNQFSKKNLIDSYQICLLFLELEYERVVHLKSNISYYWKSLLNHLIYYSACDYIISDKNYNVNLIRLINMEYSSTKYENNLIKSVECLEHLEVLVNLESNDFKLHLPNLRNVSISKELLKHTRKDLLRKIKLNKVPKLFEEKKWSELVNIIQDNLRHDSNLEGCDYWIRDLKTQFEVLLQALWNMCDVENCLIWSEMCFDFVVDKFFKKVDEDLHQSCWAESINYILTYLESSIIYEGYEILNSLGENLPRLIQNVIRVLSFHLDPPYDRHSNSNHDLDVKQPVVVLHQILLREESKNPVMIRPNHLDIDGEEIDDLIPQSFLILFTAHEFLGKRQLCTQGNGALLLYILDVITPNLRAPLYDSCRDIVYEYLEQVTYCLYGFPPKKARSRHIEEHESTPIEISWINGLQLFDLYRPESLPGFNSYKLESVSGDMEQLLLKVVSLMPKQFESTSATLKILQFISGVRDNCPDESDCIKLPYKISSIYYLLADYYFKNRDLSKALKYYTLDLACNPTRLDSWAGMALSKQSKIETKLNDFLSIELTSFLNECEDTIRCFEQCIRLNQTQTLIWIEYGSFCYCIHSFCSRHLKQLLHKMSLEEFAYVEEKKESMLNKAYHCFTLAANLQDNSVTNDMVDGESFEEKWLCQYMLGKITEKRKEKPKVYINYYLTAAHYLYESSATYPIKINHSNPTPLSVEALEVFYRTNSAIIKFLEHEKKIERETGVYFKKVLKNLSRSPFAFNKAKVDGNSLNVLKRKISTKSEDILFSKQTKVDSDQKSLAPIKSKDDGDCDLLQNTKDVRCLIKDDRVVESNAEKHSESLSMDDMFFQKSSPSRRNSNESSATAGSTTTESASSSTSSSTNSSDASSTGSESENESDNTKTDHKKIEENAFYTKEELLFLYDSTVKNLEECATRFPEHYKSIYRLVYHYMNAPEEIRNLDRCEQLLLGQYTTNLGNQINGIFFDRKSNNIFNGIWKLPSTEIDRPGSFSTHLVKCVSILIQMLLKRNNYKLLIDIGLQLYKTPDNDKRYIKDMERIELYQQSVNFCVQIMRDIFRNKSTARNDSEILTLLIDIYKTHKKCVKHINQKEPLFTQLLTEVYKFYIQDKIEKIPENLNFLDLAIKLCLQEISSRKNQEKTFSDISNGTNLEDIVLDINNSPQVSGLSGINSSIHIPGLLQKAKNRTNVVKYNPNSNLTYTELSPSLLKKDAFKGQFDYSSSAALMNPFELKSFTDLPGFQGLVAEYYKLFDCGNSRSIHMSLQQNLNSQGNSLEQAHSSASLLPAETSITPFNCNTNVENVATQNFSLNDIQASCSKISNSTNYRESDLVPSSAHSSFSEQLNVNNSLSLFIAPPTVSERNNSKPFDTLYNPINTKEMLSSAMFYKPFADNSNTTTDVTPLTKQDSTLKQQIDPTTAFLHFAENLFNPVNALKTKKPQQLTPYSDQMIQSESNKGHFKLVDTSTDIKQYNQSTTFLTAYTDLINDSQPSVGQASTAQTPSSCQKRTITKRMPKSKVGLNTRDEAKKKLQTVHPYKTQTVTLNAGALTINTGSFNLHTSTILPSSFKTSLQNISNSSLENSTEPLKTSPKTLQQKLAERQRASQQNDACETSHNNKASEIDLIILD